MTLLQLSLCFSNNVFVATAGVITSSYFLYHVGLSSSHFLLVTTPTRAKLHDNLFINHDFKIICNHNKSVLSACYLKFRLDFISSARTIIHYKPEFIFRNVEMLNQVQHDITPTQPLL
jgi:hypothetical protein